MRIQFRLLFCVLLFMGSGSTDAIAQAGWQWGIRNGPDTGANGEEVALAAGGGSVFATGVVVGDSLVFGTHVVHRTGGTSLYITKADSDGIFQWVLGTQIGDCFSMGMCADNGGNVFILFANALSDSVVLDTITLMNPLHQVMICLAKISPAGRVVWATNVAASVSTFFDQGGIDVDAEGNVYIAGSFNVPSVTIGSTTLVNTTPGTYSDVFVAKYNYLGHPVWAKSLGGNDDDHSMALCVATEGSVYVTGLYRSDTVVAGADTLVASYYGGSGFCSFLSKFDLDGHLQWARSMGGSICLNDVKPRRHGGCVAVGKYNYDLTLGSDTLAFLGGVAQALIVGFTPLGEREWENSAYGEILAKGSTLTMDTCGNAWICGLLSGRLTCDGVLTDTPALQSYPLFMTAYDECGHYIPGTAHILGSGSESFPGIAWDRGNVYIAGDYIHVPVIVGPDTLPAPVTGEYLMIAKYRTGPMPCADTPCHPVPTLHTAATNGMKDGFELYPNPASDQITVEAEFRPGADCLLEVRDMYGRLVRSFPLLAAHSTFYIGDIAPGAYMCGFKNSERIKFAKLAVIR